MFNLIVQFYYQWKKGKAMGEGLIVQCLQNMTARITALPYQKKIRKKKEKKEIWV
jgi:predicted Na+-dependent transporter